MNEDIFSQEEAFVALTDAAREEMNAAARSVLIAHAFVRGGEAGESERPISVGGSDLVSTKCFSGFDYVALGHLHRRQTVDGDHIRYSGSLYKYSFSESAHEKSVNLVEMDSRGQCTIEYVPLTPKRDVRVIRGYLKDLLENPDVSKSLEDYLMVSLLGKDPILDAMGKIQEVYPNALHIERPDLEWTGDKGSRSDDHRKLNDSDLFQAFFTQVTGDDLTSEQRSVYEAIVGKLRLQEELGQKQ
jgi:exonuclease SbcD